MWEKHNRLPFWRGLEKLFAQDHTASKYKNLDVNPCL